MGNASQNYEDGNHIELNNLFFFDILNVCGIYSVAFRDDHPPPI